MFAIDAQLSPNDVGGSETHVPLQIDALAKHAPKERFLIVGSPDHDEDLRPYLGANMEMTTWPVRYAWFKPGAPPLSAGASDQIMAAHGVKVVHFPYPQHWNTRLPFVYEPWGVPHRHFPETFQEGEPAWIDALMGGGCRKAAIVLTATRWARQDIATAYGLPLSKFAVLPRNPTFQRQTEPDVDAGGLPELPEHFALMPGAAWAHKNHVGLLRAMARLRDEHGLKLNLVATGKTDTTAWASIQAAIAELGLADQVRFLGPIPRAQLDALFGRADFLIHPSKFEGLGLPLVEAMSAGLPILASTATCIPEVVGDGALLFDPDDTAAMAAALKQAMESPALLQDLKARASRHLQAYFPTHQALADSFVALYKHAGGLKMTKAEKALMAAMQA